MGDLRLFLQATGSHGRFYSRGETEPFLFLAAADGGAGRPARTRLGKIFPGRREGGSCRPGGCLGLVISWIWEPMWEERNLGCLWPNFGPVLALGRSLSVKWLASQENCKTASFVPICRTFGNHSRGGAGPARPPRAREGHAQVRRAARHSPCAGWPAPSPVISLVPPPVCLKRSPATRTLGHSTSEESTRKHG